MASRGRMGRNQVGGRSGGQRSGGGGVNISFDINTDDLNNFVDEFGDEFVQDVQMSPPQHPSQQESNSNMPPPSQHGYQGGGDGDDTQREIKSRGQTSWVWQHYTKTELEDPYRQPGEQKKYICTCLPCKAVGVNTSYKWKTNDGTGTLKRHLQNRHDLTPSGPKNSASGSTGGQSQLHGYMSHMPGGGTPFVYNRERMIDEFSNYVIGDELPFNKGESANFEYFVKTTLQPAYSRVPRNTLKRRTQTQFYKYRSCLIEMFRNLNGRVSFTSDTWSSSFGEPFLCITAHWIDENWFVQKRIICFEAMEERHTGYNIKTRIIACLKEFHCLDKMFSLSLDNATANTKCVDYLKTDNELHLLLGGDLMHVRCCAHILNFSVQEGLNALHPLLNPIRSVIKWIRITSSVRRKYMAMCKERGLRKKQWCLDTPTRWGSTYKLLVDAIKYREVLTQIYNETRINPTELITDTDWNNASYVRDVLQAFDHATHIFSYVYEPNIHLVIVECVTVVNTIKEHVSVDGLRPVLDSMLSKWYCYFSEFPVIYGVATILDPGVKDIGLENILEFYYSRLGIDYDVDAYVNKCKFVLESLYNHYSSIFQPQSFAAPSDTNKVRGRFSSLIQDVLKKKHKPHASSSSSSATTSSINEYLSFQHETQENFEFIKWWCNHELQFPILARIAKDILAVPASSVASESAFSAGKRVLDEKRSRLTPESIQICVCKKDWDQAERRTQGLKQDEEDEEDPWMLMDSTDESDVAADDESNVGTS